MTKGLAIVVTLLVGGASLAMAQTAPTTGGAPPANVVTTPTGTPGYGGPGTQSRHASKHHKKMYMSAKSHKGAKMNPAGNAKPQMKNQ